METAHSGVNVGGGVEGEEISLYVTLSFFLSSCRIVKLQTYSCCLQ